MKSIIQSTLLTTFLINSYIGVDVVVAFTPSSFTPKQQIQQQQQQHKQQVVVKYNSNGSTLYMNLFDRFNRVAKANINNVLKSLEDPEKILNQAVEDMQVCCFYNNRKKDTN